MTGFLNGTFAHPAIVRKSDPRGKTTGNIKFKVTTDSKHSKPVTPDLLEQDFSAAAPNQKWTSDITYVWTNEGWLYLAVVMDLYSRAIVGWAMNRRMTQPLVYDALTMALFRRGFPKSTIIHSDRGGQYCSHRYQRLIKNNGLRGSMGRRATCYRPTSRPVARAARRSRGASPASCG